MTPIPMGACNCAATSTRRTGRQFLSNLTRWCISNVGIRSTSLSASPAGIAGSGGSGRSGDAAVEHQLFDKNNAKVPGILAFSDPIQDAEWDKMKADIRAATAARTGS